MVVIIRDLELYIEDIYYPHSAKKIAQIFNLLTDEIEIPIILNDSFMDLKVLALNSFNNKELSVLYNKGKIFLNLEHLESFPHVSKSLKINSLSKLRHVRIELRYMLIKPKIVGSRFKKQSSLYIMTFPKEIHITLPLGCRMTGSKEGYAIGLKSVNEIRIYPIETMPPFIYEIQGKRIYNYDLYINNEIEELLTKTKEYTQIDTTVEITYYSKIEPMAVIISIIIPLLLLCFSLSIIAEILNFMQHNITNTPNSSISFLILLMAYFYFHHSYIKDGFYIPYRNFFTIIFLISLFAAVIWSFLGSTSQELLQIVNIVSIFF